MDHIERLCPGSEAVRNKSSSAGKKKKSGELSKQKWAILSLSSIPLVMTLGNSMLIPVLPSMEKELSITAFQTNLIITVYSIVAIFLFSISRYISDHIGKKKLLIQILMNTGM